MTKEKKLSAISPKILVKADVPLHQLPAGRVLDFFVCEKVFKRECYSFAQPHGEISYRYKRKGDLGPKRVPDYSSSKEIAWLIVDQLIERFGIDVRMGKRSKGHQVFMRFGEGPWEYCEMHEDMNVALCRCALRAVLKVKE